MERVAFLVEKTGVRLGCLLNPENIVTRRTAGIRTRAVGNRPLTGPGLTDDPLLFTGGGTTELKLDLLFDISVAGSTIVSDDVRDLTRPLWQLAETTAGTQGYGDPPLVRFVWGKSWNFPGVVVAIAERLEYFTTEGAPQRSWLRMKLLRVNDPKQDDIDSSPLGDVPDISGEDDGTDQGGPDEVMVHQIVGECPGPDSPQESSPERLDAIAYQYCGFPWWKPIAEFNDLDDPTRIASGTLLRIPLDWVSGSSK
jgi:hypothetical protein